MRIKVLGYNIFQKGGTSQSNLNLISTLSKAGHEVTYVNFVGFQNKHLKVLKKQVGHSIHAVHFVSFHGRQSLMNADLLILTRESLFSLAREVKIYAPNTMILGEIHGPLAYVKEDMDLALEAMDAVRVSTQEIAKQFAQRYDYPYVFPMYVNTDHIKWKKAPSTNTKNLLIKARFEDEIKEISYALKLMYYTIHTRGQQDIHLYLQGYGPSLTDYKQLIEYYDIAEYVHINEAIPSEVIYLSTSPYETLGFSILESIAAGYQVMVYPGHDDVLRNIYSAYQAVHFISKDLSLDYDVLMTVLATPYTQAQRLADEEVYTAQFASTAYADKLVDSVKRMSRIHHTQTVHIKPPQITAKQQYWKALGQRLIGKTQRMLPTRVKQKLENSKQGQQLIRGVRLANAAVRRRRHSHNIQEKCIFIESFHGKNFSGDPKYIALALKRISPELQIYVSSVSTLVDMEIRSYGMIPVRFASNAYIKAFEQCRYIIINGNLWNRLKKQEGQEVIQTWHGFPLKRMVNDLMNAKERIYQSAQFRPKMLQWDALLISSKQYEEYVTSAFGLSDHPSLHIMPYGAPRNSYLIQHRDDSIERQKVQEKYLLTKDESKRYILFCPTWRKTERQSVSKLDLKALLEALPIHYEILIKLHPNEGHLRQYYKTMHPRVHCFMNELVDIQELYLLADILMTDYSSAMFDYAHLNRPIFILDEDVITYGQEIGFYFDVTALKSIQHVQPDAKNIAHAIQAATAINHEEIIQRFMCLDTQHSDECVAQAMMSFGREQQ
ncbi:CDP-glycerol glycerophosphotransferase family protein [Staphylococcus sp. 17KM0847]|uniref:CDP-glycerol glycerophosphotransferase family protein n=1 Tax=Staphylococcus sp. 17KM0847 TaxID=2583989 RepID=UPI0015DC35EF|nr:CDP-glycerol glycerophosphotransferase family protein [Staphylococcus sp. 17KM0847]QLK85478.1 CDP-glycerol--glycerophosphate glycerophosphotransferase [Staphylococcus sp. 17KM0847]